MADKYIFYDFDGERYRVPVSEKQDFESKAPDAKVMLTYDGENYGVPLSDLNDFVSKTGAGNLTYSAFDEQKQYSPSTSTDKFVFDAPKYVEETTEAVTQEEDDKTGWGETIAKGLGAAGVRTAKLALDLGRMAWNTSVLGGAANKIKQWNNPEYGTMDERLRDEDNAVTKASMKLGDVADRLSKEADPTGGEKGFTQLIREGKIGQVAQKALGSGLESLPMMIAAGTGWGALLYGAGMAAGEYSDETRENPEIASWKRGIKSLGSAALEMAVEKIGGPLKNIGSAGKNITEEMAKEILETAVKEGTENAAKRIIKKIGKQGVEEGGEELLTSFGNDALGQALDWIDGNTDYGITAQWEKMKEENPDASLKDFAWSKAEEYMDSFIGGAVSGMEISATVDGANYLANRRTGSVMDAARNFGASRTYGDMYDLDADVTSAKEAIASAFTNQDGEQTVSNDFIDGLTADDAFALSSREELSGEQRRAFRQLALMKATQDGLTQKLDEELENRISTQKAKLEAASDNGNLVAGMVGDKAMYIKGGIVKDGRVFVNEEGASGPVIVVDPKTGEETTVNSGDITAAIAKDAATEIATFETNAREYEAQVREKSRTTMSAKAKFNAVKPLEGKKLMVDLGNGIIEVKIQQVLPESGEVLVKGKKGDLGGQSNIKIGVGAFYDSIYRDDDGNPIITEGESELDVETPEVEEPTTETIDEPIEITGEEDFRDYSGPILINGVPTNVAVQSQDDATDSVVYTYTDENGNTQRGTATVREFAEAVQNARPTNTEPAPQPAPAPAPAPTEEPIEEPISNGPVVEVPVTPQTIDWDVLFEQDPEGYFAEMQNQFGDKTAKRLNAIIAATQKRLDALNKANPQTDNEILENEEKKEKLEAKIAALNEMVARLTAPVVEEVIEPETPEVPETPAPVAEEPAEPEAPVAEPVVEEPAEPETPVVEEPAPQPEPEPAPAPKPVEQKPVAPNPVADPVSEAQKIEKELRGKLDRVGIPRETKQDWARRAGKRVGDLFATREEYGAYEAIAEDLGEYLAFFEGGVEESFAKRSNIESGSPEVSVPLTEKPKESNNGETGESAEGRPSGTDSGRTSDEGDAKGDSGNAQTESKRGNKGEGSKAGEQVDKYPARKGNATQKLLVDTFGFNSVTIPNTRKSTLNAIYDFMMEMSKMLGISPKSIGQGGWLSVGNLRSNAHFAAVHEMRSGSITGEIKDVSLKFKYDALTGIAHEWFHALDYALEYFDSGVRRPTTSEIDRSKFSGRKEVWDAVDNIVKAINESGHPERMKKLVRNMSAWSYWLSPKEMCARAFDEYILNKFREAGIQIEGTFDERNNGNPTPEEMAVIAPAFDNLFKILKEKEGKTPGSSVLYRIEGEEFTPTELQQEVAKYVVKWITDAGYTVHTDINELQEAISRSESEKTQFLRTDDGVIYGLVQNGEIYLDPALLNPNTPIHEYTHIWDMIIMEQNPQLWEEGKKLLKQLDLWNEIANSEQYKSLRGDEDLIASEVHSRLVGEKGEEVFTKLYERASGHANETGIELSLIIRIKNWIRQIMENIKSIIIPYSSDKSVSLQEFVSMPLNDLVFNARPRNRYTETHRLDWGEQPVNALSEFATLPRININEFNGHAQQYYSELENGIGYVVYDGSVYIFDIDSDGLARPIKKFKSYEEARRRVDVFNRRNISGHNSYLGTKRDKTTANIYNNSSNGIRGASENVPPVVEGESGSKERLGIGRQNNETEYSVRGSSVESDGLLFRSSPVDAEMEAIKNEAIANGTFMKAPNGQPTKLNERQWLQVRTKNFLNWFGDWINDPENASKVVDENGEPLVVYHGTGSEFFVFRNSSEDNELGAGFYFTDSYNTAERYAKDENLADNQNRIQHRADDIFFDIMGHSSEDLYDNDSVGDYNAAYDQAVYELFSNSHVKSAFLNIKHPYIVADDKSGVSIYNGATLAHNYNDGIIDNEFSDRHDTLSGVQYVVFNPNQIKSATDNEGTFDKNNPDIRYRKEDIQNAAVDYLVGDPRLRAIENAVNEEASKLGVTVTYKTRSEMPKGHENDKGYFNTETGEIVICTENAASIADAIQTILHESVAHKGLRQLMGDKFNEFINRVYNSLDAETKAKVDALATEHYNGNTAVAVEEYMASLAETEDFANNSVWEKIKSIFEDIINTILGRNDIKIGDNELRYILRASYNNMVNPKNMDSVRGWAQDQMMREEYKINEATPEILSRTGITPTEVASESARETYNRVVSEGWQEFQRQFQDAMQPMRIAIEAIQQETGNMPVEDYENFLLMWNQISSRSRVEIDNFARRYYDPIFKQVQEIIDQILESRGENKKDESKRAEVYAEIRQYMFAKHGLERNLYYQANKTRKLRKSEKDKAKAEAQKEYDEKINAINADTTLTDAERELQLRDAKDAFDAALLEIDTREVPDMRDYSGLTALFGMDDFKKAEEEAQKVIDEFESKIGKSADKLWEKINKATDKTLRHSYESGLISRQQYNDIKAMFQFYIPLRGFDETTAEDVYSYARFEGNKFNPAVQTAKGRTSLADDPLAIIMNMAESEIAQGNKNRAKQALYNFILNRTITDENGNQRQNSLMKVESVWYIKNEDKDGNAYYTIATPNHSEGETYEEFEAKMNARAAEDKAYKSKKGNVDVGMRFQKPTNANAHYIYLKVNGVEKAIYINGDPKAAEAVNGTRKPTQMFGEEKMRAANRILSSTFTNYSLEFTARNYFRDMIYSHINIGIREQDPAYRKKFRQNWRHNNLGTMMKLLKAYRAGELGGRALTEDEAAFVEFMNAGGQTGYTLINSVENHKKDLERAIKNMQKGLEHGGIKDSAVFKATLGGIELLNESSELVTRFAAFKTSRDMGRSVVKSVNDAKEVTVNFNTKGAQDGKGWMGFIANYLGWSKFFFNASVQGVQNIKAMADANKLRFCGTVGGVMAFGFFMPIITSSIAAILGADDDEEEYWNIPEYDRQNNFCIPVGGGKYVKVPLPIGFREVYALGDMVAAMAFNKKFTRDVEQVGIDMANKIAAVVLPINPLESTANGLSVWHSLLNITLPSSIQFAVQNMANIDWKGAPLQKEYTYNENDPQWMKAYSSNPDWMVCLSKWCNEHIGDGDMKGLDWSPEKLDNTLSNLFGGIYTLVKKTGKSFSMIWNEENRNLSNVPLTGVILGSGIDKDDRFVTDAYYDEKEYYDDRIGFIKRRAAQFGFDLEDVFKYKKGQHQPKMMEIYNSKEFDFMQEWYEGNKRLESLEKEIKKFEKEIAKHADPSEGMLNRLAEMEARLAAERREFVNDILELD